MGINMRGKKILLALMAIGFTQFAFAGSTTGNFQSTASLSATCILSGGAINFGAVTPGSGNSSATGTVSVTCSNGLPYDMAFSAGNSGNELQRSMTGSASGDSLSYNIYTDSTYTTIIGDGSSGTSHPLSGNSGGRGFSGGLLAGRNVYIGMNRQINFSIYGTLSNNQYPTPDTYSDNLTVTVSY